MRIQACPALMDWLVFLVLLAVVYGAGERGLDNAQCAWLGGVFQLAYMVTSLVAGVVLSRRNARAAVLASTVLAIVCGVLSLFVHDYGLLLAMLGGLGVMLAVFFNAFQAFMRGETRPGNLTLTVARYTLAWSVGSSLGFLSSGLVYRFGVWALAGVGLIVGGVILTILLTHEARAHHEVSADEHVEEAGNGARPVNPAYVAVGWCMIFTAMFVQRPLQNFFPVNCARAGMTAAVAGVPLFLHMFVQGLAGWGMPAARRWLYRRTPLWLVQGAGGLVLFAVWLRPGEYGVVLAGMTVLGVYTGFAYFSAVYYASNSGRRAFNIGVNECLVGLGSLAGLFASEWWMRRSHDDNGMYLVCAVALAVSALVQVTLGSRGRQPPPGPCLPR